MYIHPWSRAGNRLQALTPLGDVPSGRHAGESLAPISIRSIRQYRTTGHGTDSGKFIYAGEARKIFSNSVIETGVLRGCWLAGPVLMFLLGWCNRWHNRTVFEGGMRGYGWHTQVLLRRGVRVLAFLVLRGLLC